MRRRLPIGILALGFASFFTDVASEMIFPLLPAFIAALGGSTIFLGLVEGVADAVASFVKIASGYLSDRFGRRKELVLFGYGIAAVVRPLMGFAMVPLHVLLVRVTDRIGKGIRTTPRDALIAATARDGEVGRAFGFQRALDSAGAVVGPMVATLLLAQGMPMRQLFLAASVPGLLSLACVLLVHEPARVEPVAAESPTAARRSPLTGTLRRYLLIVAAFALGNVSDALLLLRAIEIGVPIAQVPMLWTNTHLAMVAGAYLGGGLADRLPRARLIAAGWFLYALSYVALGVAAEPQHAWLVFLVYGASSGMIEPADRALLTELTTAGNIGRAFGYYHAVLGVSAIVAGLGAGSLWQVLGARTALLCAASLTSIAAAMLLLWDRSRAPSGQRPSSFTTSTPAP